ETLKILKVAEEKVTYMTKEDIQKEINALRKKMEAAAKELDFIEAAKLRDEMKAIEVQIEKIA
ncbi:MAG: UvrB/UvrC motif-containing protein, partial [Flavobacteriales bacterium]